MEINKWLANIKKLAVCIPICYRFLGYLMFNDFIFTYFIYAGEKEEGIGEVG
jgi:hypothetical protein